MLGLTNPASCGAYVHRRAVRLRLGCAARWQERCCEVGRRAPRSSRGGDCSLPERVTSVSRQGMSWTLLDPQDFLESGRTGIYEIDLMLASLNPARALARPRVFSPDLPRATAYQYAAPPLSLLLEPGDQVLQKGLPARWVSNDIEMLDAVRSGRPLTTSTDCGVALSGQWHELVNHAGGVVLDVAAREVDAMWDGVTYVVQALDNGQTLLGGTVRVLEGG